MMGLGTVVPIYRSLIRGPLGKSRTLSAKSFVFFSRKRVLFPSTVCALPGACLDERKEPWDPREPRMCAWLWLRQFP